ncbi:MAG TPA: acyl dehydratase, partial [Sphingobium sp.]|nr:acyl dehydratase [Sphingobium sp.]
MSDIVYFEDVAIGDVLHVGPIAIDREEVIAFAGEFDPQPFHL